MLDLISKLPAGARVLDLGARSGSFHTARTGLCVVRLDLETPPARPSGLYVRADAARMPFAPHSFDAILANHSLEHFRELEATLREIGRVVRPAGALFVAVPCSTTLTDRIYRWMGRGGGHVNAFRSPEDVVRRVEAFTGLPHRGTRVLYSSLSFLNAHNFVARPPRKIALFAFGNERFLAVLMWLLRTLDGLFGTRLSRYGWSFYFGAARAPVDQPWINVCVRCGSGHSQAYLRQHCTVRRCSYRCPACGGFNLLSG